MYNINKYNLVTSALSLVVSYVYGFTVLSYNLCQYDLTRLLKGMFPFRRSGNVNRYSTSGDVAQKKIN